VNIDDASAALGTVLLGARSVWSRRGRIDAGGAQTMSTIQIDVPESVLLSTGQSQEEFVREAKFLLALKLFELGRLSSGKAAEMCGMNRVDFILLAGRSGVPVADLDDAQREREFTA
jgi:predicted HTH domain antitoxin